MEISRFHLEAGNPRKSVCSFRGDTEIAYKLIKMCSILEECPLVSLFLRRCRNSLRRTVLFWVGLFDIYIGVPCHRTVCVKWAETDDMPRKKQWSSINFIFNCVVYF